MQSVCMLVETYNLSNVLSQTGKAASPRDYSYREIDRASLSFPYPLRLVSQQHATFLWLQIII